MSKGNTHDDFDFGNDPEFQEKFYKNIDRVLSDIDIEPTMESDDSTKETLDSEGEVSDYKIESFSIETENKVLNNKTEFSIGTEDRAYDNETESSIGIENEPMEHEALDNESDGKDSLENLEEADDSEIKATTDEVEASQEESAAALEQLDPREVIDETLYDINTSLAKQISDELEHLEAGALKNKKRSKMMKIQMAVIIGLVFLLGTAFFLGFTKPGNQLLVKMGINIGGKIWSVWTQDFTHDTDLIEDIDYLEDDDLVSDAEEIDPDSIVWPDTPGYGRREEGVYNILLLGEEAIGSGTSRGRTDLIIIATLNKNNKSIKLTSLMRDTLVQIPGYKENRLNSAYEKGDVNLLYETIAMNFNIHLDGSVLVNFENFEKIIDYMGGLELTLTSAEARYLRNTNYISNPKYRTVVEGTQLMNGNQVLGYSRIRKRATITGENNDYGRTDRHRIILNAIFEKYKTKSELELGTMMFKILPMVKTDIDSKTFEKLLSTFIEMGTMQIEQLRVPVDGAFTDNVKVRGMDVLIPDLEKNIRVLHEFVFGN